MAKKNFIVGGGFVLLAFAAGLFIGKIGSRPVISDIFQKPSTRSGSDTAGSPGQAFDQPRGYETVRDEDAPRVDSDPVDDTSFSFSALQLDTSTDTPRACFGFTRLLNVSGSVNYADFIKFSPAVKVVAEPVGKTVCFDGLDFDKDYQATLREGLPNGEGEILSRSQTVTVSFGDKPAYVGFAGNGVILPRMEADGIGIETVNVSKLQIDVRRVGERALAYKNIVEGDTVAENRYGYAYDRDDGEDVGVMVWSGEIEVTSKQNKTVTTVFPLGAALGKARRDSTAGLKPGAYFISIKDASAGAEEYRPARSWRWIMFTDLALTTYMGGDGMDVIVRSLETARPVQGVLVKLIAQNNDILAEISSDGDGRVRFPAPVTRGTGPLRPTMIMAYGAKDDFAAIDLNRSPLDLSDRDVSGRHAASIVDSYVYFDRGIYRPGETAHISGLIRDARGIALTDRAATLIIRRPNYTEAANIRLDKLQIGGFSHAYEVPKSAPRGVWTAVLKVDGSDESTSSTFSVEDFVPQRIAVELTTAKDIIVGEGQRVPIEVDTRFLYGAPGAGLKVEGEARLRVDPAPFAEYRDYTFGDERSYFSETRLNLGDTMSDGDGKATLTLAIDQGIKSAGRPLRADIVVGVAEPGGRVVQESTRLPVRVDKRYIGIRRAETKKQGQNEPVEFEIVVLNTQGAQISVAGLEWRVIEEDYRFEWYRQNNEWRWRRDYRDILIATDVIDSKAKDPVALSRRLDYGSYRLELKDPDTGAMSTFRFYAGWSSYASGAQSPDQAVLTGPSKPVKAGARAKVTIAAPYAGEAMIVVATDRIHEIKRIKLDGKPQEITINTDASWGGGVYVLATVVTPRDAVSQPVPRRAMGVTYIPFDMGERTLDLTYDIDEMIRPRQKINLPIKIKGAQSGEQVMLTIAAVDEGILRLTKFKSPKPEDWFYGKKALAVRLYDDYGRLLNPNLAAATTFGGDQLGGEGLTVVPTKSVALFNGIVELDGSGTAKIPVEIPDFNGELRLMTVAWTSNKLGSVDRALTVRDPVPAELALPRFLGPQDVASTTLLIDNVDGKTGVYKVNITGDGPVSVNESANFNLAQGQRQDQIFPLKAEEIGIADITLSVTGPDDFAVSRSYPIQIRAPYFPVTKVTTQSQKAGVSFTASESLIQGYLTGSTEVQVSYSPLKGIDAPGLLASLSRYPYGCTEQLTSSSYPLLYANALGAFTGEDKDRAIRPRVQRAINKILSRQSPDGSFGLWRAGDRYASGWVGAYVTDFLYRAKQEGYFVPDEAMDKAYDAVAKLTSTDRWISVGYITRVERGSIYADKQEFLRRRAAAYSFYVLARAGRADLSDIRYFHDSFLEKIPSPLARMHIGAALAMMGDRSRAANAMAKAEEILGYNNRENYYQSPLRDTAAMVALASELENTDFMDRLTTQLDKYQTGDTYLNTQEKSFLLLASAAMLKTAGDVKIAINGMVPEGQGKVPAFTLTPAQLSEGVSFTNEGGGSVFRNVSVYGTPKTAPAAINEGFTLTKRIRTLTGKAVDLANVQQNDRFVVSVSGQPQDFQLHPAVVVDMLPPGFEIESVLTPDDSRAGGVYRWLGDLSYAKVAEARDDRFVAAIDLRRNQRVTNSGAFKLAYVVRAITPGTYVIPGAVIEDMYRPGEYARTSVGSLTVQSVR